MNSGDTDTFDYDEYFKSFDLDEIEMFGLRHEMRLDGALPPQKPRKKVDRYKYLRYY